MKEKEKCCSKSQNDAHITINKQCLEADGKAPQVFLGVFLFQE
jgi:hypothetical protein